MFLIHLRSCRGHVCCQPQPADIVSYDPAATICPTMSSKLYKFVTLTHILLCLMGLMYQILEVSVNHFKYSTGSEIKMYLPLSSSPPSMSTCWRLVDVLKLDVLKVKFGIKLTRVSDPSFKWNDYYHKMGQISVGSILRLLTPSIDEVFARDSITCVDRANHRINYNNDTTCKHKFKIRKFLQREYVCYKFKPMFMDKLLKVTDYSLSSDYQGLIYRLYFNIDLFDGIEVLTAYVHEEDSEPLFDSLYSSQFSMAEKDRSNSKTQKFPKFKTSYQVVRIELLKPPYDTKCRDYPFHGSHTKYKLSWINNQTRSGLNRTIPYIQSYDQSNQSPLLLYHDFSNQSIVKPFNQLMKKSESIDLQEACIIKSVIPISNLMVDKEITFTIYWPVNIHVFIATTIKSTILDFIIYCSSCLGLWFGLSVYSMIDGIKVIIERFKESNNSTVTPTAINKSPPSDILSQQIKRKINVIEMKMRHQLMLRDMKLRQLERLTDVKITRCQLQVRRQLLPQSVTNQSINNRL